MSNLKIGGQNVGKIFLGDTQIFGGLTNDISSINGDTIIVLINNSGHNKTIEIMGFSYDGYPEVQETIVIPSGGVIVRTYESGNADNYLHIKEASTIYIWEAYKDEDGAPKVFPTTEKSLLPEIDIVWMAYYQENQMSLVYITA